jgi:hypothetical protein
MRETLAAAARFRNAFKALSFLYCQAIMIAQKIAATEEQERMPTVGRKGAKAGAKAGAKGAKAAAREEEPAEDDEDAAGAMEDGEGAVDGGEGDDSASFPWEDMRPEALAILRKALCACDLRKLWPQTLGIPEEAFLLLVGRVMSRFAVHAPTVKDRDTRGLLAHTMGMTASLCARQNTLGNVMATLVGWVSDYDHTGALVSDMMELWAPAETEDAGGDAVDAAETTQPADRRAFVCPAAATEVFVELGARHQSSKDAASLRRAAAFIVDLSARLPALIVSHVPLLLPYLDCDSYALRCALITSLGNVVSRLFSISAVKQATAAKADRDAAEALFGAEVRTTGAALSGFDEASGDVAARNAGSGGSGGDGADEGGKGAGGRAGNKGSVSLDSAMRNVLMDVLLQRAVDTHSLVRAATMKAWQGLLASVAVPADRFPAVVEMAAARALDKTAAVRRAAIQLLRALLEMNPFAQSLDPDELKRRASLHEEWLAKHAPHVLEADRKAAGAAAAAATAGAAGKGKAGKGKKTAAKKSDRKRDALLAIREEEEDGDAEDVDIAEMSEEDEGQEDATQETKGEGAEAADMERLAESLAQDDTGSVAIAVTPEAKEHLWRRDSWRAAASFASRLARVVPLVGELLSSKTGSDVMESVRFLARARSFSVPGAEKALAGMLKLIWSQDKNVKEEVIRTFDTLYILDEVLADTGDSGDKDADATDGTAPVPVPAPAPAAEKPKEKAAAGKKPRRTASGRSAKGKAAGSDDEDDGSDSDAGAKAAAAKKKPAGRGASSAATTSAAPTGAMSVSAAAAAAAAATAARREAVDPQQVADNLVKLLSGAAGSMSLRASVEEVMAEATRRDLIPSGVVDKLWTAVKAGVAALETARTATFLLLRVLEAKQQQHNGSVPDAVIGPLTSLEAPELLARIRGSRAALVPLLSTARSAMALIALMAATKPQVIDAPVHLATVLSVLSPASGGAPVGPQILTVGYRILAAASSNSGKKAGISIDEAASLLEVLVCAGDYQLAQYACAALLRVPGEGLKSAKAALQSANAAVAAAADGKKAIATSFLSTKDSEDRGATISSLLQAIVGMLRGDWDGGGAVEFRQFYPAAQTAIDAIFSLARYPVHICADLLNPLAQSLVPSRLPLRPNNNAMDEDGATSAVAEPSVSLSGPRVSRVLFVVSHVAVKSLIHADMLAVRVKTLRIAASEKVTANGGAGAEAAVAAAAAQDKPSGKGGKKGAADVVPAPGGKPEAGGLEDQLGANAAEDEKEAELLAAVQERELLATDSMIGVFTPIIQTIAFNYLQSQGKSRRAGLKQSVADAAKAEAEDGVALTAILAMCRLMSVSMEYAETHLRLMFMLLAHSRSEYVRATIATTLGDITFRFPNAVEPYTTYLYARLRDSSRLVRRNLLMVITHLVLNGMIKVRGQVAEVAVCLRDEDPSIVDLAKTFFFELSKRGDNQIYNILPDTLSHLSRLAHDGSDGSEEGPPPIAGEDGAEASSSADAAVEPVDTENSAPAAADAKAASSAASAMPLRIFDKVALRDVVKFLLSFVSKDKQIEGLADKLIHRFEASEDSRAWRDSAFCLSQLPHSERTVRKLADPAVFRSYKKALGDEDVWSSFSSILARARKAPEATKGAAAAAAGADAAAGGAGETPLNAKEMRQLLDDWDKVLTDARSGQVEMDATEAQARAVARRAKAIAVASRMDIDAAANAAAAAASASIVAQSTAAQEAAKSAKEAAKAAAKAKSAARGRTAVRGSKKVADDSEDDDDVPAAGRSGLKKPSKPGMRGGESDSDGGEERSRKQKRSVSAVSKRGRSAMTHGSSSEEEADSPIQKKSRR